MDNIIAYAGTFILSISFVATFIASKKYKVAKEIIEAVNTIVESAADGKITKAESEKIIKEVKEVIASFK